MRPDGPGRLELQDAAGALERLETWLSGRRFFDGKGPAGRRAELYLGYRLSEDMRRTRTPPRPEPVSLPALACHIVDGRSEARPSGPFRIGSWERTWEEHDYRMAISAAREAISAGEVYQVNLVQHLRAPFTGDPLGVAAALASLRPLHGRPMQGQGWTIVSASPELFLARHGDRISTMPIKGTRPSGGATDLRGSAKDAAEHIMIVDLERNDLGRICRPGTIRWPQLMQVRAMAGVEHLVSTVEGRLRPGVGWAEAMVALFPGGSVTGAPKIAALDRINALEPVGRGASMGALGSLWPNGDFELALTIRTFAIVADAIHLWVGGGVVWDSDPAAEVAESWTKARPLLDALAAGHPTVVAA
jgi:para-aminobenzoate synthetase component 1